MAEVLVVEQAVVAQDVLARALRREGYSAMAVGSGDAAAELRRRHPDVIVVDADGTAADGDGGELLERLHADPARGGTALVLLAACCDTHALRRARRLESRDGRVSTAFSVRELLASVRRHCDGGAAVA